MIARGGCLGVAEDDEDAAFATAGEAAGLIDLPSSACWMVVVLDELDGVAATPMRCGW